MASKPAAPSFWDGPDLSHLKPIDLGTMTGCGCRGPGVLRFSVVLRDRAEPPEEGDEISAMFEESQAIAPGILIFALFFVKEHMVMLRMGPRSFPAGAEIWILSASAGIVSLKPQLPWISRLFRIARWSKASLL